VKPARFEYVKAVSVADAVSVLAEYGGDARVLAGGQSLVPLLGMRLLRPAMVVDVNGLREEIGGVEVRGSDLHVGALVRYSEIETSDVIAEHAPLLAHVVTFIGDRQVRNRGTLGGALAQADPTGEMALASLTLGARVHARGPGGEREIPIEEFFLGSYATALAPEEMVTGIAFPLAPTRFRFFERGRKHNDFAVLSLAVVARPGAGGAWEGVRIGLGGANDRPVLAVAAAQELEARAWDPDLIDRASRRALEAADPPDDVRATAEYRSHLLPIHLRRLLADLAGAPTRG
jgi:carbon-monoxide dehydrogenase medium subunit